MPCWCGRGIRGFGYDNREYLTHERKTYWFCSMDHMKKFKQQYKKDKTLIDPSPNERTAIKNAHQFVGEWLKEKGETDLRKLSQNDQYEFMMIVYGNVCQQLGIVENIQKVGI